MSAKFELTAESRSLKGKGASRRLRHTGMVPAIIYGAGKEPQMIAIEHKVIRRHLSNEKFHVSILTVKVGGDTDQAILREWQMHPVRDEVTHVDFQRISSSEKIHMKVPLHFTGGDVNPGVKLHGGILSHLMTEIDVTCLPAQLPEYLAVDVSSLGIGESVHLSNIPLPEGVTITSFAHGGDDLAVVSVMAPKAHEEAAPVAAAAAAPEAEAKSAGDAKKPEGKKPESAPKKK